MAKDKSKQGGGDDGAGDRIPAALKEFGQRAAELAQNPVARSVIAAGLVTAAAALTANQKVRDTAKKTARDAADATEEAAANASRIGEALVTAAADTFRKLFNLDEGGAGGSAGTAASTGTGGEQPLTTPAKRSPAKSGGKAKSAAKSGAGAKPKTAGAKSATKKAGGRAKPASGGTKKASAATKGGGRRKASAGTQGGGADTGGGA